MQGCFFCLPKGLSQSLKYAFFGGLMVDFFAMMCYNYQKV
jgi:hypothetical protein